MTYLIGQIVLCLLLASVLGLVVGWLLRGVRCRADINLLKKELQARGEKIEQCEQRIVALQRSMKELENSCKQEQQLAQERIQQLEPYQAEAVWLRQELDNTTSQKNKQITHLSTQLGSLQSLKHDIKVNETIIQRLESQLRTQAAAKNKQVNELRFQLGEMQPLTGQLKAKDHELRQTAAKHKNRIDQLTQQLHQLQARTKSEREALIPQTAGQNPPGQELSGAKTVVAPMPATPITAQPTPSVESTATPPDTLKKQNSAAHPRTTPQSALSASPDKDDLKKIYGIGPVMERTLNHLGITSFKQIMEFTRDDVERVTAAIKVFPGRIERDDWIGGAKKEHRKKYATKI